MPYTQQTFLSYRWLTLILLAASLLGGCAHHPSPTPQVPVPLFLPDDRNPNAAELNSFVQSYPTGSEQAWAARFLVENLPLADRLSMTAHELRENLDYAFLAWRTMPWGKGVPRDVFAHYVLPHRTSQEPFEPHRAMLFAELAPICLQAASMEEALSRVASWCAARAEYRPTSRRDLGVRSILRGGWGRCEETNILFMAAARAVGLPVRQAMVPWWQHADGNHAWVEAWTGQGWAFLESGTEFSALNRTWFASESPRMPKVAAHAFGRPDDPAVYRTGPGFALVDTTGHYTTPRLVRVMVMDQAEQAVPGQDVYFSVFSLGGLRPATRSTTDSQGLATAVLGPGVFVVSCAGDEDMVWSIVNTRDQPDAPILLNMSRAAPLAAEVVFSWPKPGPASAVEPPSASLNATRVQAATRWNPLLEMLPPDLSSQLSRAGQATPGWLRLLHHEGPTRHWIPDVISSLDDKDLLQADPDTIVTEIDLGLTARDSARTSGLDYDDEIFLAHVLQPRIFLEPWSSWRAELWPWLKDHAGLPLKDKLALAKKRVGQLQPLAPALFGPSLTPLQLHQGNHFALDMDQAVLATAILRTLGVPARYQHDFNAVEYYDGHLWQAWQLGERPVAGAALRLMGGAALQPLKDFGIGRVEKGHIRTLDDLPWEKDGQDLRCRLQPGRYVFMSMVRDTNSGRAIFIPFTAEDTSETGLRPPVLTTGDKAEQ